MTIIKGGFNLKFLIYDNEGIYGILEGDLNLNKERMYNSMMFIDIPIIEIRKWKIRENINKNDILKINQLMIDKNSNQDIKEMKKELKEQECRMCELKIKIDKYEEKQSSNKIMEEIKSFITELD